MSNSKGFVVGVRKKVSRSHRTVIRCLVAFLVAVGIMMAPYPLTAPFLEQAERLMGWWLVGVVGLCGVAAYLIIFAVTRANHKAARTWTGWKWVAAFFAGIGLSVVSLPLTWQLLYAAMAAKSRYDLGALGYLLYHFAWGIVGVAGYTLLRKGLARLRQEA